MRVTHAGPPPFSRENSSHMSHRTFTDPDGRRWEVWDVHPATVEPQRSARINLPAELREGWLAFQTGGESRRLAPIPATWPTVTERDLNPMLTRALRIPREPPRVSGNAEQERQEMR